MASKKEIVSLMFACCCVGSAPVVWGGNQESSLWEGLYMGVSFGSAVDAENRIGEVFDLRRNPMTTPAFGYGGGIGLINGYSEFSDLFSGLQLGYNWIVADTGLVAGIEGEIGSLGAKENWLSSLRGRVGLAHEGFYLYGTGGVSYFSVEGGRSTVNLGGNGGNGGAGGNGRFAGAGGDGGMGLGNIALYRRGDSEVGLVGGIGVEYKLNPSVAVGVEGLYYSFDDELKKTGYDTDFYLVRGKVTLALGDPAGKKSTFSSGSWEGWHIGIHGGMLLDTHQDTINGARLVQGEAGGAGADGLPPDGAGGGGGGGGGAAAVALLEKDKISLTGGIGGGYNWQRNDWVYGIETDASFGARDRDYLASLRGKIGPQWSSHWLYLTGGMAFTRMSSIEAIVAGRGGDGQRGSDSINRGGNGKGGSGGVGGVASAIEEREDLIGFVIGGGIETQLSKNLTMGIEALYYGFDDEDDSILGSGWREGSIFQSKDNSDAFVLRTRLVMYF